MAGKNVTGKNTAAKNENGNVKTKGVAAKNQTVPAQNSEQKRSVPGIEVRIDRLINRENSNIRAIASANIGGAFAVHGLKVMNSHKGLFVAMPSNSYHDENNQVKYSDIFHAVTAEARSALNEKIMCTYEQALQVQQAEAAVESEYENEAEDEPENETQVLEQGM